jgi:hypothetical protein
MKSMQPARLLHEKKRIMIIGETNYTEAENNAPEDRQSENS